MVIAFGHRRLNIMTIAALRRYTFFHLSPSFLLRSPLPPLSLLRYSLFLFFLSLAAKETNGRNPQTAPFTGGALGRPAVRSLQEY